MFELFSTKHPIRINLVTIVVEDPNLICFWFDFLEEIPCGLLVVEPVELRLGCLVLECNNSPLTILCGRGNLFPYIVRVVGVNIALAIETVLVIVRGWVRDEIVILLITCILIAGIDRFSPVFQGSIIVIAI